MSVLKQYRVIAYIIHKSVYHPVVKEKIIKIIQYYTQFLIAYHKNAAKTKLLDRLKNIQYIMSTCRKSIRFGRSLNHVYTASQIIEHIRSSTKGVDLHVYGELSEELFNVVHFFLDSRMLLYRAGILTTNDTLMDNLFYIGDFGADLSVVIHSTLKLLQLGQERQSLLLQRDGVVSRQYSDSIQSNSTPRDLSISPLHLSSPVDDLPVADSHLDDINRQLMRNAEEKRQAHLRLTIWSIQLISSGNYPPVNVWRRLFGSDCPGTIVGLSGVLSSSLVLYKTVSDIAAEYYDQKSA